MSTSDSDNTRFSGNRGIYQGCGAGGVVDFPPHHFFVLPEEAVAEDVFSDHVVTPVRIAHDSEGVWFEFGWVCPDTLVLIGNSVAGWQTENRRAMLEIEQTEDFVNWNLGRFIPCAVPVEDNGDGTHTYWSRAIVPEHWKSTMVNLTATSDFFGKSITSMTARGETIELSGYPYSIPEDLDRLKNDLEEGGYAGSIFTYADAPITATAKNHTPDGAVVMRLTHDGPSVTDVSIGGVTIPLSYPYPLPGDKSRLQGDLRSAGNSGAVVKLHAGSLAVTIPDQTAAHKARDFTLRFSPGDPFPFWNFFKEYMGLNPDDSLSGYAYDTRTPSGTHLQEAGRQFARLRLTSI